MNILKDSSGKILTLNGNSLIAPNNIGILVNPANRGKIYTNSSGKILYNSSLPTITIDLEPYCDDEIGLWNKDWSVIRSRGTDVNWMWSYLWIPVGAGNVEFDMVIHESVGHITAWNDTTEIGTYDTTGSVRRTGEWEIPSGSKYLRVERPSGISSSIFFNYFRYVGAPRIPDAYQEVEYIESTGLNTIEGAYLDTGLLATSDMCIDITLMPTSESANDEKFFGVYSNGIFIGHYLRNWGLGGGLNSTNIGMVRDQKTRLVAYGGDWKIGSDTASVSSFGNSTKTMLVGASHYDGTNQPEVQYGSARFYQIQIKKSSTLHPYEGYEMLGCFIPCCRKSDGEVGMYDTVTGTFHGHAGNIAFTKGPYIN